VLLDCVQWKLPKLWQHMHNLGMVEMSMFENATYPWFLSLFTASLPLEPMLRAWDCFFHEGVKVVACFKRNLYPSELSALTRGMLEGSPTVVL